MIDNDKERFFTCLVGSAEVVGKQLSKHGMKIYWEMLKDYDIESVEKAFIQHGKNPDAGQFMPKPADIIKHIDGGGEDRALLAWAIVDKSIRRVGQYVDGLVFDDPIIHAVVDDMGGWTHLCNIQTEDDLHFQGIEFSKRYRAYTLSQHLEYPAMLRGISEQNKPPILIGDREKAKLVLQNGGDSSLKISTDTNNKLLTDGENDGS